MAKHHRRRTREQEQKLADRIEKKINRDALVIARRERHFGERRVYSPQDDRRLKFPSEDFYGHIERNFHDANGRVIESRQMPVNRNRPENNENNLSTQQTRTVFDDIRVSICQRRNQRREVLFARRKTGKGAKQRTHLWTAVSKIICKH